MYWPADEQKPQSIAIGSLVIPTFSNEFVKLLTQPPSYTILIGTKELKNEEGPSWSKDSTGLVLNKEGNWYEILVSTSGRSGWITIWHIKCL